MSELSLTITDNRTGETIDVPVVESDVKGPEGFSAISAPVLRALKAHEGEFGLLSYDPSFGNTASTRSAITFIDGDRGVLRYRGYQIADLADGASFEEVAYLILNGELPDQGQLKEFTADLAQRRKVSYSLEMMLPLFRRGTHPMTMLISLLSALGAYHPEATKVRDEKVRRQEIKNLIAKVPVLAAWICRHTMREAGLKVGYGPITGGGTDKLGYAEHFLSMLGIDNPVYARALDVLFTLHADHEQNCSANAMRGIGSAETDPYSAAAGAAAALYGPLHGGANEAVLKMLARIGNVEQVPAFIDGVKEKREKLMGFGHRVYKNYDPRAKVIKTVVDEVLAEAGSDPLLEIAVELERIALEDDYFVSRKLYPNVDFYSGLSYKAMGFEPRFFTVLFAIARMTGWLAQWDEMLSDPEQKIARPRQLYVGHGERQFVPLSRRS